MPRDLADVLHYFLPEIDDADVGPRAVESDLASLAPSETAPSTASRLPILGLPIGERDVVRAALAWNLSIETARLGGSAVLLAPEGDGRSPLFPAAGPGPLGTELIVCPATDLESLYASARELAKSRANQKRGGGIVFVRIPPAWLLDAKPATCPVDWALLLTSANRRDLRQAFDLAKILALAHPRAEIGVTVHGVSAISEARAAYEHLSRRARDELGLGLASYGLLVDDLHVYRAIAAQRPIGLAHPQAPATRALMDVARLLFEDAGSRDLG